MYSYTTAGRPAAGRRDWLHQIAAATNKKQKSFVILFGFKGKNKYLVIFSRMRIKQQNLAPTDIISQRPASHPANPAKKLPSQRNSQPAKQPARISKMKNEKWDPPPFSKMKNEKWNDWPRVFSKMKDSKNQKVNLWNYSKINDWSTEFNVWTVYPFNDWFLKASTIDFWRRQRLIFWVFHILFSFLKLCASYMYI